MYKLLLCIRYLGAFLSNQTNVSLCFFNLCIFSTFFRKKGSSYKNLLIFNVKIVGQAVMETCESLVVKEENNPLEVDYSIVGVKELATPEIKKEVEKLQLETKGKDFMVLFLSHFLFIALPKKI